MNEINICIWYGISREQRLHEKIFSKTLLGTSAYEARGCYDCCGLAPYCPDYFTWEEIEEQQRPVTVFKTELEKLADGEVE